MSNAINKEDRTVYSTNDYRMFKLLGANRPTVDSHVNSIIKSIEKNGSWLQDEPIIVNESMEVIDGQHRLAAHKQLDLPIYYQVAEGLGIERAHAMNRSRRNWTILDWAHSYANNGNINYVRYLKLLEDNDQFSAAAVISACSDKPLASTLTKEFRTGELSLTEADYVVAQQRLDNLAELAEIAPLFIIGSTTRYVLQVFTHPKYSQERMVKKMKEVGGETFVPSGYIGNVLAQLERAYNRGSDLASMVRFQ
jgi:hypothetical protein